MFQNMDPKLWLVDGSLQQTHTSVDDINNTFSNNFPSQNKADSH